MVLQREQCPGEPVENLQQRERVKKPWPGVVLASRESRRVVAKFGSRQVVYPFVPISFLFPKSRVER